MNQQELGGERRCCWSQGMGGSGGRGGERFEEVVGGDSSVELGLEEAEGKIGEE